MPINLKECAPECTECIRAYIKKHKLRKGDSFEIPCSGIPKQYISEDVLSQYSDPDVLISIYDPVVWAAKYLDWHCLDPDGKVWERKTKEGKLNSQFPPFDEEKARLGKSPFHRPYQAISLRCTSKRKLYLWGRQLGKSEGLVISALHGLFTNDNYKIITLAPFQSQIDMLFSRIPELLERNPNLYNSIKRMVKAPHYTIELNSGSYIKGFSAGTRSKGEAGSVRGQPAHRLLMDEADYLSAEDVNAVAAVITNFPNAEVVMSSTPTGRRENFYNTYHGKIYKSFHYSSKVNPMWSEDLEKYFRSQLTEIGYQHEVEALFGEQEEGVYQNRYIEMCQDNYEYSNMKPDPRWTYSFGVDWNDVKIGTVIVITGFNPANHLYYVVDKHVVSKAGWTQTAAMQKIVELNRMWRPEFIYIDKGFGYAQEEILHGFGYDAMANKDIPKIWNNDARIAKIVKSYDFGGSIEIRDLFTKKPVKKPAKPFLVENAVRKFERNELRFPRSDQKLFDCLSGYVIKNISQSGTPVYGTINEQAGDHLVDALNLSLIGFTLEGSALGKPKYITDIAFSGQFGESPNKTVERTSTSSRKDENLISEERVGRTEYIGSSPSVFGTRVPAVSSKIRERRIWSWPGFLKDKPPPQRRRASSSRSLISRPQRKNI